MQARGMAEEDEGSQNRVVALYDFDPTTIDWPFRRQKPLALITGQVIQVIHDDGSEWALGCLVGQPEIRGYFPKNYTVLAPEYREMMNDFEHQAEVKEDAADDDFQAPVKGPPETRAIPSGPLPVPTTTLHTDETQELYMDDTDEFEDFFSDAKLHSRVSQVAKMRDPTLPEQVYPGVMGYPALEAQPPLPTVFDVTRSRLLNGMPPVPDPAPEEPAPPDDDIMAARWEVEKDLAAKEDIAGGEVSHSRCSTPATYAVTRPERDFVRPQMPVEMQERFLKKVTPLAEGLRKKARLAWQPEKNPYPPDLRVRHTTIRMSAGIEPTHMRFALQRAQGSSARWTQMFRPGFNDIVNESFMVGCNACILSKLYLRDKEAREAFQKLHIKGVNGTMWFELQRRKQHLFYMRMDFIDVMMSHPDAWGFPDTNRIVAASSREPVNPFHGWCAQVSIDTDREMEDVEFIYSLRCRSFPERIFSALAMGKIPEWVKPYLSLHAEAELKDDTEVIDEEATAGVGSGKTVNVDHNLMMEAGLEDGDDLYVKLDELRLARERTSGPDVLDAEHTVYRLKGLSAMRIFLRSRGNPDNMKQSLISPKMVKDMAAQLGIRSHHSQYWYCLFALRYPLSHEWESVVKNDTRWYLHLSSDRLQPVHPMIKKFREHLRDVMSNEFLWDFRNFVKIKCSECGIPDSVVWCQQCTDYYCAACFLNSHKSKRGRKHWPMPVPGCRYLSSMEAHRLTDHLPLLNVGFSNRRRFLSRDNQSDKNGARDGDTWLWFHADTFQAALVQTPQSHWLLKRKEPPRLAPGIDGYFYNFATDTLADDASYILQASHEQKAVSLLQRHMRGCLTRKRIKRETAATLVLQKTKLMWDVQKVHGSNGRNAGLIKSWYRHHRAATEHEKLEHRISHVQAVWRGVAGRKHLKELISLAARLQACYRGKLYRRRLKRRFQSALRIQKVWRGYLYGRRVLQDRDYKASKIQAMFRGVHQIGRDRNGKKKAIRIQAHVRGWRCRRYVSRLHAAALKLQTNWRRFQAQLDVKLIIYDRVEQLRLKRQSSLTFKLQGFAASLIQRNVRKHRDYSHAMEMRREKGEADKRTNTLLVAMLSGASELRHFVHPWFRHLPKEIQDILAQMKSSMQRSIATAPVTGKLDNEEIGYRGLRVGKEELLTFKQDVKDPDLASHMLLAVSRHLLSHVPANLFPQTIRWSCYAIGHQAVSLYNTKGFYEKQVVPVGKEMPAHPNDRLNTLYKDLSSIEQRIDQLMTLPDESMPCLILKGIPAHHRHVFLTAEVLVTMRQALKAPSISTDDHLKFQGLDASSGAQLMEVFASELDHRLPLDWPSVYGTVASLAAQLGTHISEMKPEKTELARSLKNASKTGKDKVDASKGKITDKGKDKDKDKKTPASVSPTASPTKGGIVRKQAAKPVEASPLSYFARSAMMRILQQVGYLMRDQDKLLECVLAKNEDAKGVGVRQSRHVLVADKLFEIADKSEHDHCSFVLAVVLFHMILRGLMMRLLYHRAAITLQKRIRYMRQKGKRANAVAPSICIQRFWRGLKARLMILKWEHAADLIQQNWRAWNSNQRAMKLVKSTLLIQRVWIGAVQRKWIKDCHKAALKIQRFGRGMLTRVLLDRSGRELARRQQAELTALSKQKGDMPESMFIARMANLAAKARIAMHRHRERNVDLRRMAASTLKSRDARLLDKRKKMKLKGSFQVQRCSIWQPVSAALKERDTKGTRPMYGTIMSIVLMLATSVTRSMTRQHRRLHPAAKRGAAARTAKRLAKVPEVTVPKDSLINDNDLERWMNRQIAVRTRPRSRSEYA